MGIVIPPVLVNLPRPRTIDDLLAFGKLVTVVDSDGPHTTAPSDLVALMRKCGNPLYQTNGGFSGRVTQYAIDNWGAPTIGNPPRPNPNASLPQPIRPEDMNKAIIGQCSYAGMWAPDNATANPTIKADSERTDHPIFWVSPLGKDLGKGLNVPVSAASPYGQIAVKGSSGTPWAFIDLIAYGMAAMDQAILVKWKAAGMLWSNIQRLLLPVIGQADGLNWWAPVSSAALMPAVCLAGNTYTEAGGVPSPFKRFWDANAAQFPTVPVDQAEEIFEAGQKAA